MFWYILTTETKTTNGSKKNTAHFWKAMEIYKIWPELLNAQIC